MSSSWFQASKTDHFDEMKSSSITWIHDFRCQLKREMKSVGNDGTLTFEAFGVFQPTQARIDFSFTGAQ